MGCSNSSSADELQTDKRVDNKNDNDKKSQKSENSNKKDNEEKEKGKNIEIDNKKDNVNKKQINIKKETCVLSTEENKSNLNTAEIINDNRKISLHKQVYEGTLLMKGIEESIPENLSEENVYQLVEEALNYRIVENDDDKSQSKDTITKAQVKAIASILYNKINKCDGNKNNSDKINLKDYPELKGMNIKIEAQKLTKDIIRNMMFQNKKVDECQIDLTYANLTRENDDIKALTIEINT
jgi:hypothetical protein